MEPGGRILARRWPNDAEHREWITRPRSSLLTEVEHSRTESTVVFRQEHGPFSTYERIVELPGDAAGTDARVVERTRYRLQVPWFKWAFAPAVRAVLRRRISGRGWWAPPDQLDASQVLVLGLLAAASMSAAFINTLFTQTAEFAADDFGVSETGIGDAGSIVRAGIVFALPAAVIADRIGRRRVVIVVAWLAPLLSLLGALAPSFNTLVATQTLGRPMGIPASVGIA